MTTPAFEAMMVEFERRGLLRVPHADLQVNADKVQFSVRGPRDSIIYYTLEGLNVSAWFGKHNSDSGGMYLHGFVTLPESEPQLQKESTPSPLYVPSSPQAKHRARLAQMLAVLDRARWTERPPPKAVPVKEPERKRGPQPHLSEILRLHRAFMASGRRRVLNRHSERKWRSR